MHISGVQVVAQVAVMDQDLAAQAPEADMSQHNSL
jgi:hypothetical protein